MKKEGNELLQFIAGIIMLVAGLFIFSQKVVVSSGLFYGGLTMGGIHFSNGIIMIPLIAGIIWMFVTGANIPSRIMTGFGVFVIVLTIILSTNISLTRMTLFDWVVILVLIFGGVGLLIRVLIVGPKKSENTINNQIKDPIKDSVKDIEEEIERIKKDM